MRLAGSVAAATSRRVRPSEVKRNATCGLASARVDTTSETARVSAATDLRNLARAGALKNRLLTSTVVPRWRGEVLHRPDAAALHGDAGAHRRRRPHGSPARAGSRPRWRGAPRPGSRSVRTLFRSTAVTILRGRVAVQAEESVLPAHADAVVGDADAPLAAALDGHLDPGGARRPGRSRPAPSPRTPGARPPRPRRSGWPPRPEGSGCVGTPWITP